MIFVIWGVGTIVFLILNIVPRDPATAMAAGYLPTEEQIAAFNKRWGFDRPIWWRYVQYFSYVLRGDLGVSIYSGEPVFDEIIRYYPFTFELATFSIMISLMGGIFLGILSALQRNKLIDQVVRIFSLIGVSTPAFWLGIILLLIFYVKLDFAGPGRLALDIELKRITGFVLLDSLLASNWEAFWDSFKRLLLPSFAIGYRGIGMVSRITRANVLDIMEKDYVKAAIARGIGKIRITFQYILRNALIPVVTILGILYGAYLGGSIVIEVVFSRPGIGYFGYQSVLKLDHPAILGVTLIVTLSYSIINFLVDVLYRFIDPRIKFEL
jgi:peptide/nickel transport system permease protein